ncbi:hypothetical protein B5X24_HaOG212747 [Helicoverpa armigera]|uniref:Uncharacterized protein n=1 Tax=Helicoverpa armigera TaxID=29058 RepID=A0A2W1BCY3_HELAM|nr:hypothetical protein B5X24_HaOG212747 [Helicoverpa armigera]
MVIGYFLLAIFIIIIYSLTHDNSRYYATASAIRQVWTGDCRLGCQASTYSDVSGLSALGAPPTGTQREGCVCESCPCALIEDFLKKCGPATQLYTASVDAAAQYYNNLAKKFQEVVEKASRVLQCRTSCRRQAQLVDSRSNFDSNEDFTMVEKTEENQKSALDASVSEFAKQYGDEIATKIKDIASRLSTSTQPVQILPKPPQQEKPPDQENPTPDPTHVTPSTSFKTRPPFPENKPHDLPPPSLANKPHDLPPPSPAQDMASEAPQIMTAAPSPFDNSTATKPLSIGSSKPSPTTSKKSVHSDDQTCSKEPKVVRKVQDPESQTSHDSINCSKCVEQGKICIRGCPTADERADEKKQKGGE